MTDADLTIFDELDPVVDHLNADHDDTVLFVIRHLAMHETTDEVPVVDGRLTRIHASGIGGTATLAGGDQLDVEWPFATEPGTIDDVRVQLFQLLAEARAAAPAHEALTSLEREVSGADTLPTHLASVVAVADLTPSLRQITFGGLEAFESLGGDQFLYVLAPPPGRSELTIGADFTWSQVEEMPAAERPVGAYYTVRRWRPDAGELDMWFVLHDDGGAASTWAANVDVGCPVGLWGPRQAYDPPADVSSFVLVVDDSGLGAAGAILDELAARDHPPSVQVIAETASPETVIDLPTRDRVFVQWLFRGDRPAGTGTGLLDAVRRLDLDPVATSAFGAAESRQITAVRTHLRHEVGLPAERVSMTGYWRRDAPTEES